MRRPEHDRGATRGVAGYRGWRRGRIRLVGDGDRQGELPDEGATPACDGDRALADRGALSRRHLEIDRGGAFRGRGAAKADPRHRESEELAFLAERAERSGDVTKALAGFARAAELEEANALAGGLVEAGPQVAHFRLRRGEHDDTIGPKLNRQVRVVGTTKKHEDGHVEHWASDVLVIEEPAASPGGAAL